MLEKYLIDVTKLLSQAKGILKDFMVEESQGVREVFGIGACCVLRL